MAIYSGGTNLNSARNNVDVPRIYEGLGADPAAASFIFSPAVKRGFTKKPKRGGKISSWSLRLFQAHHKKKNGIRLVPRLNNGFTIILEPSFPPLLPQG
jgi:hypothetical protein